MENELEVQYSRILKRIIFIVNWNIHKTNPCIFHSNISRLFNELTEFIEIVKENRKNSIVFQSK